MRAAIRAAVAASLLFGLAASAAGQTGHEEAICTSPAVWFCENWEDRPVGTFTTLPAQYKSTGWGLPGPSGNYIVESSVVNDGTKALQIHYPPPNGSQTYGGPGGLPSKRTFYARWYERWSTGFSFGCGAGIKNIEFTMRPDDSWRFFPFATSSTQLGCGTGGPASAFGVRVDFATTDVYSWAGGDGATFRWPQNINGTWVPVANTWYCLEARFTANTAGSPTAGPGSVGDGYLEGWVDNVKHIDYPNVNVFRDANSTLGSSMMVSGYYNCTPTEGNCADGAPLNDHIDESRYHDNFVLSDSRIGCLSGGGGPSDTPKAGVTGAGSLGAAAPVRVVGFILRPLGAKSDTVALLGIVISVVLPLLVALRVLAWRRRKVHDAPR